MPVDVDSSEAPHETKVFFSRVTELISAATFLGKTAYHDFNKAWVGEIFSLLSEPSKTFLGRISTLNWPTLSLVDLVPMTGIYQDTEKFLAEVERLEPLEFTYILMNQEIPKDAIGKIRDNPNLFSEFYGKLYWISSGSKGVLLSLIQEPESFRASLIRLLREMDNECFERQVQSLSRQYGDAIRNIQEQLKRKHPLALAEEIKGKKLGNRQYSSYIFSPSYFLYTHNIMSYSSDIFYFMFNINAGSAANSQTAEKLASVLKVLADKSRLELLKLIRQNPSYGKELADAMGLTTATVSRHLDQLKTTGLIKEEKADAVKYVSFNEEGLRSIIGELETFLSCCSAGKRSAG